MNNIDFTQAVGIGELPQEAIKKANEWLGNSGKIEVITCWYDFNEVYLTVKVIGNGTRIIGLRIFDISDKWQISEDFSKLV